MANLVCVVRVSIDQSVRNNVNDRFNDTPMNQQTFVYGKHTYTIFQIPDLKLYESVCKQILDQSTSISSSTYKPPISIWLCRRNEIEKIYMLQGLAFHHLVVSYYNIVDNQLTISNEQQYDRQFGWNKGNMIMSNGDILTPFTFISHGLHLNLNENEILTEGSESYEVTIFDRKDSDEPYVNEFCISDDNDGCDKYIYPLYKKYYSCLEECVRCFDLDQTRNLNYNQEIRELLPKNSMISDIKRNILDFIIASPIKEIIIAVGKSSYYNPILFSSNNSDNYCYYYTELDKTSTTGTVKLKLMNPSVNFLQYF